MTEELIAIGARAGDFLRCMVCKSDLILLVRDPAQFSTFGWQIFDTSFGQGFQIGEPAICKSCGSPWLVVKDQGTTFERPQFQCEIIRGR